MSELLIDKGRLDETAKTIVKSLFMNESNPVLNLTVLLRSLQIIAIFASDRKSRAAVIALINHAMNGIENCWAPEETEETVH